MERADPASSPARRFKGDRAMTELHEIFADALPTAVFVYASAGCLMVCVLAALWIDGRGEQPRMSTRTSIRHATFAAAAALLLLAAPSASRADPVGTNVPFECALHDPSVVTELAQHGAAGSFYKAPVYEACAQSRVLTR
jgi:hypothetical protein